MNEDRRATYRVRPENEDALRLSLIEPLRPLVGDPGEASLEAPIEAPIEAEEIVDITIGGAGTRFPSEPTRSLAPGDPVRLVFSAAGLERPIEVEATVAARLEVNGHSHLSFTFAHRHRLERELPRELFRLFNRRKAPRAEVPPGVAPLLVRLNVPDAALPGFVARSSLRDISETGLGALAEAYVDEVLADVESVEVSLRFPESERVLRIAARIRNRNRSGDGVHYGLMFDAGRTRDFVHQRELVSALVAHFAELDAAPDGHPVH